MRLANRGWTIGTLTTVLVLCLSSVGLYLFARDAYSESQIQRLIEPAYHSQRPGGGRLSGAPYSPIDGVPQTPVDLGRAQLLLLRHPDPQVRQRLQGMIYLATGDWRRFADSLAHLSPREFHDPVTMNNLGASFLALSDHDSTYLLKAMDQFERASQIDPKAVEPRFNLVITYRKLRLPVDAVLQKYEALDSVSVWYRELKNNTGLDESALLDELRRATESSNHAEAERLFEQHPELYRRAAMLYGVSNIQESPASVRFIADQIERRYGDKTVSAMLAPLFTERREVTVAVRGFVLKGARLFAEGNLKGSLEAYTNARKLLGQRGYLFDELWIDVNSVDTEIRVGQFDSARKSLQRLVRLSRDHHFVWLMARALLVYGSTVRLTESYTEMMHRVEEADRTFVTIDASSDRFRPLYYLAYYRYGAGDHDEAFRLALECRRLIDDADHGRISTLNWLIGSILYRQGLPDRAVLFARESVAESQKGPNATVVAVTASTLTQLYEAMSEEKLSEQYLAIAEDAFEEMAPSFDQIRTELLLGIVKATIELRRRKYSDAESVLEKNLDLFSRQPFQATRLLSSSLMLLARTYSETGRLTEAAQKFNEAIDVVESDDEYLQSEKLRVTFDDSRRDLYDSAIEFKYNNGSPDEAWMYLQKYRAKLFLEFLGQFNPKIERARTDLSRARVQKLVPADAQVIEYALLKDRLLIWFITDRLFVVRAVQVSRADLEAKVQEVLQKLRKSDDTDALLTDLGKLLIEPVADLLDPNRTIAIIPDRALHGLPFAALRRPGKKQYLIEDFSITVSPSLTHLLATEKVRPRRDAIAGFGSQNGASSEMKELEALRKIYPEGAIVAGQDVDKTRFLDAMSKADVFHYAGHSATDAVDPLRSSILLDGNRNGPNSVTAVDIAQQRLVNNAVVILSSCDSSVGNSRDGIGVRGLTSAFLIGGAGSVVGSLWPVEASSTADLMIRFHRSFATSQLPVAKALRQAQLDFLEAFPDRSHPYYWSGFVVTGNLSALR